MPAQILENSPETSASASRSEKPAANKRTGQPMRVLEARFYRGPNIYAYRRAIRLKLDLGIGRSLKEAARTAEREAENIPA